VLTAAGAVAIGATSHFAQRIEQARTARNEAQAQMDKGEWEGAIRTLQHGLAAARRFPVQRDLADELDHLLHRAELARTAADRTTAACKLHHLADRIRFLYGAEAFSPDGLRGLEAGCRGLWENRGRIVERLVPDGGQALDPTVRNDLCDLAI